MGFRLTCRLFLICVTTLITLSYFILYLFSLKEVLYIFKPSYIEDTGVISTDSSRPLHSLIHSEQSSFCPYLLYGEVTNKMDL